MNQPARASTTLETTRFTKQARAFSGPAPMPAGPLYRYLFAHCCVAFVLMGICFVLFGLMSLNLVQMLVANLEFLGRHGVRAVAEGGLRQFAELVLSGYTAAAFYVGFKLCEKALVDRACSAGLRRGRVPRDHAQ